MIEGTVIPEITFMYREGDEAPDDGGCPIGGEFVPTTTEDLFAGKRVVVFSLPGAYTPTCSTYQLPGFEANYDKICEEFKVDEIYVSSVNDGFVMNAWAKQQDIQNVKVIPDGSGNFTRFMGMLIGKNHLGFGLRSWRYMAVFNDGVVEKWWQEPGINNDGEDEDPYGETTPQKCIDFLEKDIDVNID